MGRRSRAELILHSLILPPDLSFILLWPYMASFTLFFSSAVLLPLMTTQIFFTTSYTARWQALPPVPSPPRSGHATAADAEGNVFLFGGYAETPGAPRDVVNDLLRYSPSSNSWSLLSPSIGRNNPNAPGPRLVSTCAHHGSEILLFGGWDPESAGSGGIIFDDVWSYSPSTGAWEPRGAMPGGPASRHCAVNVGGTVIVHTHKCVDHVLVWDSEAKVLRRQGTTGEAPSPRGLHAAAAADNR